MKFALRRIDRQIVICLSHLELLSDQKMKSFFRDEVASIFDEMDVEGEGKLTFLQVMGGEESPLENLFRSMDKSASGSITKEVSVLWLMKKVIEVIWPQL